jgi:drug/metabolite transporter (DMT)-like permease
MLGSPLVSHQQSTVGRFESDRDSPSTNNYNNTQSPPHGLSSKWTLKNISIQLLLIVVMTTEMLVRKANTTLFMENYRSFLNIMVVAFATIAFFGIAYWLKVDIRLSRKLAIWFAGIAMFDTLATYMIILSNTYVSAPFAALLSQGVIPVSIILSIVFLKKSFHWTHYAGASTIMLGIGFYVLGMRDNGEDGDAHTAAGWAFVFFLSNLPIVVGSLLKEILLTAAEEPANMHALNAWVGFFQVFLSLLLAPASYKLQSVDDHVSVSSLPRNFGDGFGCWLAGEDSITVGPIIDECSGAVWCTWIQITAVVLLNVLVVIVIFNESAVMLFIAQSVSIPLTAIVSNFKFMGRLQVTFAWEEVIAVLLTFGGLIVYQLHSEEEPCDEEDRSLPGDSDDWDSTSSPVRMSEHISS